MGISIVIQLMLFVDVGHTIPNAMQCNTTHYKAMQHTTTPQYSGIQHNAMKYSTMQ